MTNLQVPPATVLFRFHIQFFSCVSLFDWDLSLIQYLSTFQLFKESDISCWVIFCLNTYVILPINPQNTYTYQTIKYVRSEDSSHARSYSAQDIKFQTLNLGKIRKAGRKLIVLAIMSNLVCTNKKRFLIESFI